ncbi:2-hydroxycarboxylate transporter family protein [Fructobacillus sp. M2-14]|uniref:2-hydroxycarboxylate transporter family protein n=1 Tax=Fructobacillus broussonetiae TaxID=2713173 RepID=A0ABS5QZV6_9LACO|nr:2-hydroxycarboxylate transporter family protein [Fructobacillus broussonetiae]MBS9338497.1 2-hydroxycarboxylate transporter family protein [Fructobacillus broussonetiae]
MSENETSPKGFFGKFENKLNIDGIGGIAFIIMLIILVGVMQLGAFPKNMMGALFIMVSLGGILYYLGANLPIVKTYLGGGSVFTTMVGAVLSGTGVVPHSTVVTVKSFMTGTNFLEFYIVSLIISAIFKMDRKMVLKAAVRFLPVAFLTLIITFFIVGGVGTVLGLSFQHTSLFITFPMMAGGVGAGIVPLSTIYGAAMHVPSGQILSQLFPPLVLSNLLAIIVAGLISENTKGSKLNGNGELLKQDSHGEVKGVEPAHLDKQQLLVGMMTAISFYMIGSTLHKLIPSINSFAFLILLAIIIKALGIVPHYYEESVVMFGQLVVKTLTHAILAGVGLALLDLSSLLSTFSWALVICVIVSIISVTFFGGLLGKLFGFYPVESAVTAGLANNSMGGTGNVAVLSAANRMNLMAFAQMGNRIGGAIVLVIAGFLITIWG